ncbi:MAG: hypothetical protein OEY64_05910 [Nitrospinota bacterium]|nr:hypothetical protein [Nitrospinota bacterium]
MASNPDREMEKLSRAIVEAILASDDVKKSLEKLQHVDSSTYKSLMVFMLRLDSLSDFRNKLSSDISDMDEMPDLEMEKGDEIAIPKKRKVRKSADKVFLPDIIDGRIISGSEKKFLDFLADNFDQDTWLREHGLTLD